MHAPAGAGSLGIGQNPLLVIAGPRGRVTMIAVRMYTTQVCPFCQRAKALLKRRGVERIEEIRVDLIPEQRARMIAITGRRTVPQIFVGDTHVGGCEELIALDQRGGLVPLLGGASA
jgi:glutaredoxin 3